MKIPKSIRLLDGTYRIKLKKLECSCGRWGSGFISVKRKEILLNKTIINNPKFVYETLLHELAHYFAVYYGAENSETFAQAFSRFIILINSQLKNE